MLGSESFFHGGQLDVLAADFPAASSVITRWLAVLCVHLPDLVVAEFVGDTIQQSGDPLAPTSKLPLEVLKSLSCGMSLGNTPDPMRTGHKNLLMSSDE